MQSGLLKKRQREDSSADDSNPSKIAKIPIEISSWDELLTKTAEVQVPEHWEDLVYKLRQVYPDCMENFFIYNFLLTFINIKGTIF